MIHLTWDWWTFFGMALVGGICGALIGPFMWPRRMSNHEKPPMAVALVVGLVSVFPFVVFLATLRIMRGGTAELEASVLLMTYTVAGIVGLALRASR